MVGPDLYNMLLFRSLLGRRARWQVEESEYDKRKGAFGRMQIIIQLGDFLQKKPVGGQGISLLDDVLERERMGTIREGFPPEYHMAMKLFCKTPLCFEFQASNRIREPKLRALMTYMRDPPEDTPACIQTYWKSIQLEEFPDGTRSRSYDRLKEERFQTGHMIAIYWATVARWMHMRAERDAMTLRSPLFLVQAADASTPPMPVELAKKLMNVPNPKDTGGMHGMLALHVGMIVRLLDALDEKKTLVKDSEAEVVRIEPHEADAEAVEEAVRAREGRIYLRRPPKGIWVKMSKYRAAPFTGILQQSDATLLPAVTHGLVFIEPRTSDPFKFRDRYTVTRTGFPISHGRVVTSTACQGRTMRSGVVIDCGRHETGAHIKEDDEWWLDLYVMPSRATRLEDLLLVRAPELSFFANGPPKDLKRRLTMFAQRTAECRQTAEALARELGFDGFLRGE